MVTPPLDPLLQWLFSLSGPALKWDIETAQAFTALLHRPDRSYTSVHVAGTNGKGSVSAMIDAIALAAGLRGGLFTSPHLVRPEERIRIGGEDISREEFSELIRELRELADAGLRSGLLPRHPSFFEMVCAAALVAFERHEVELAVLEAGLGGRLDATNVVTPALSVITTISSDHLKTLGGTLGRIASEKAGIVKPGIPILVGWLPAEAEEVVHEAARRRGAPLHHASAELKIEDGDEPGSFSVVTPERCYPMLRCSLEGPHQRRNAALALRSIELLRPRGLNLPVASVAEGLAGVRWAGRLERIDGQPPLLLDAAHNPEGVRALAEHLAQRPDRPRRALLFGLTAGRDPRQMIGEIGGAVDAVVVSAPRGPKAQDPREVARALEGCGLPVECAPALGDALARARKLAGPEGEVLVAGSLYLVGDLRRIVLGLDGPYLRNAERVPPITPRSAAR